MQWQFQTATPMALFAQTTEKVFARLFQKAARIQRRGALVVLRRGRNAPIVRKRPKGEQVLGLAGETTSGVSPFFVCVYQKNATQTNPLNQRRVGAEPMQLAKLPPTGDYRCITVERFQKVVFGL